MLYCVEKTYAVIVTEYARAYLHLIREFPKKHDLEETKLVTNILLEITNGQSIPEEEGFSNIVTEKSETATSIQELKSLYDEIAHCIIPTRKLFVGKVGWREKFRRWKKKGIKK